MFALGVVSAALLVTKVNASALNGRSPLHLLLGRQTSTFDPSDIPAQCQVDCATTVQVFNGTTCAASVSCFCTETVNTGFKVCLECMLDQIPNDTALLNQANQALSQYELACSAEGAPLSTLSIDDAPTPTKGSGSVTIPSGSATRSGSVFFSSTDTPVSSAGAGTRSVITALPTGSSSADGAESTEGTSSGGGLASSGMHSAVACLTTVMIGGLVGAFFAF
ncbi:hypothetical protein K474DRAFT_417357 [Panus rudis PR-1116 ss-1]|nr:hypothetical protein K474DRAFT_417357 [Panus rudis PR-1116 ss-1]